jgi:hypothetical protein
MYAIENINLVSLMRFMVLLWYIFDMFFSYLLFCLIYLLFYFLFFYLSCLYFIYHITILLLIDISLSISLFNEQHRSHCFHFAHI